MRCFVTGRGRVHRLAPDRGTAGRRAPGDRARRPEHRAAGEPAGGQPATRRSAWSRGRSWTPPRSRSWPPGRTGCSTWPPRWARSSSVTAPCTACAPTSAARRTWSRPRTASGARLLVASTSEIYGKNTKIGLREDDDRVIGSPLKSRWSYSEAKAIDESLVESYVRELGLSAVIVRFFNTVGPRQTGRYGMVIPRFVRQGLAGQPLTVFGTGQQVRCFCHVHDVVPALTRLIASDRASGRAVNLGSTEQVTIEGLAERVIAATGSGAAGSSGPPTWRRTARATRTCSAGCRTAHWPRDLVGFRGDPEPGRDHPGRDRGPAGRPGRGGRRELRAGRADETGATRTAETTKTARSGSRAPATVPSGRGTRFAGAAWLAVVLVGAGLVGLTMVNLRGSAPRHTLVVASMPYWNISHGTDGRARPPAGRDRGVAVDVRAEQLRPDRHAVRRRARPRRWPARSSGCARRAS